MPYRVRSADSTTEPLPEVMVFVCQGPSCGERGGARLLEQLHEGAADADVPVRVRACASTCMNSCPTGPNVHVTGVEDQLTGTTLEGLTAHLRGQSQDASSPVTEAAPVSTPIRREPREQPAPAARQAFAPDAPDGLGQA